MEARDSDHCQTPRGRTIDAAEDEEMRAGPVDVIRLLLPPPRVHARSVRPGGTLSSRRDHSAMQE